MAERADTIAEINETVQSVLCLLDRERDREVVISRFGLNGSRKTLEEIGQELGITRERVRQIEKAALLRIRINVNDGQEPNFAAIERKVIASLHEMGRAGRISDLTAKIVGDSDKVAHNSLELLCSLSDKMQTCSESDHLHAGVALTTERDSKYIKKHVTAIIDVLKKHGKAVDADGLFSMVDGYEHPSEVVAMAMISKDIAEYHGHYGLSKWPSVNPRNIRDKIYLIMKENGQPMHYSDIASAIKSQDFVRNNVSDQAIHNELIKDDRFVLNGRGIYALAENGYSKGNISDVITALLKKNGPMYRDDIIRDVLKVREVREATVLMNLQNKDRFVRSGSDNQIYALK